jgi:hypothetical protein
LHDCWQQVLQDGWQQVLQDGWQQALHEFPPATVPPGEGTRRGCTAMMGLQSHASGLQVGPSMIAGFAVGVATTGALCASRLGCGVTIGVSGLLDWAAGVVAGDGGKIGAGTLANGVGSDPDLGSTAGVAVTRGGRAGLAGAMGRDAAGAGAGCATVDDGGYGSTRFGAGCAEGAGARTCGAGWLAEGGDTGAPAGGLLSGPQRKMRVGIDCAPCSPPLAGAEPTTVISSPVSAACTWKTGVPSGSRHVLSSLQR